MGGRAALVAALALVQASFGRKTFSQTIAPAIAQRAQLAQRIELERIALPWRERALDQVESEDASTPPDDKTPWWQNLKTKEEAT